MNSYSIPAPYSGSKKYIKVEIQEYKFDGKRTNRLGKMRSVRFNNSTIEKIYKLIWELEA
jgi:hypothetical protein